jgi:hypothetical protein
MADVEQGTQLAQALVSLLDHLTESETDRRARAAEAVTKLAKSLHDHAGTVAVPA